MPPKRARTARGEEAATARSRPAPPKSQRTTRAAAQPRSSPSDENVAQQPTTEPRAGSTRETDRSSTEATTSSRRARMRGRKGRATRQDTEEAAQEYLEEQIETLYAEMEDEQSASPRVDKEATPIGTPASSRRSKTSKIPESSLRSRQDNIPSPTIQQMRTRVESTPLAGDTSIAALAHFRRRPRQPSLLHIVQNPDETFDTSELTLDTTIASDASPAFAPHDESTPQPPARVPQPQFLAPDPADEDLYTVSPRPKHGRKRKSGEISGLIDDEEEIEVMRSQTPSRLPLSVSSSLSDPRSTPSLPEAGDSSNGSSTPRRIDLDSETYADPLSSSPTTSPLPSPVKTKNTPRKGGKSTVQTTAMLRALLPRRQSKQSGDSSSSENEDDDSDFLSSRKARRTKPTTTGRKVLGEVKGRRNAKVTSVAVGGKSKGAGKTKYKSRTGGKENDERATGDNASPQQSRGRRGTVIAVDKPGAGTRTYGRRTEVEPESDDELEEDSEEGEEDGTGLSKELQAARDKFRRIDEGELEFESASLGGGSSPWR